MSEPKTLRELVESGFYDGFVSPSVQDARSFKAACLACISNAGVNVNSPPNGIGHLVQSLFQIGLMPSQHAGLVWVVTYGGKPTVTVGYKGFMRLGWQAKYLARITPQVVLDGEDFSWIETSSGPIIQHTIPARRPDPTPERIELAYVSWTSSQGVENAVRVEGSVIRSLHAKASPKSPWRQPNGFLAMVLKTPIRQAAKFWDCSTEIQAALAAEDVADEIERESPDVPVADNAKAAREALAEAGIIKETVNG